MTAGVLVGCANGTPEHPSVILARMANRHGLVAGATGTGKSVTLQGLAEQFSGLGVPVFLSDIKGDLSGIGQAGGDSPKVAERVAALALDTAFGFSYEATPVIFWDLLGARGHPVRTTVSQLGPLLLSRLLGLNETQEGVISIVFQVADDDGLLLLDLKDLRALLNHVADQSDRLQARYGAVSRASVGAILRRLLTLEQQGGERLFGEPAVTLDDLMRRAPDGRGYVSVLVADKLIHTPALYSTFLLWLLSELFEELPEVGDQPLPKLVLFFDEAHLMFDGAPKVLLDRIEQVVRLIRSKGVGIYFVTQSPLDVPESVLGQLGNRVQHALRAFTPRDQRAVRTAAQTFRPNPNLDTERVITALGVGEALVSTLDESGIPTPVERVVVAPPGSRVGPLTEQERRVLIETSPVHGHYEQAVDRESAYEILAERAAAAARQEPDQPAPRGAGAGRTGGGRQPRSPLDTLATTAARSIGSQLGNQLVRGVLGSLLGGRRR